MARSARRRCPGMSWLLRGPASNRARRLLTSRRSCEAVARLSKTRTGPEMSTYRLVRRSRRINMNNRRNFLAAGGALGALTASLKANADQPHAFSIYLHGMVWNRQLTGPMNDWLVRFDATVDIPIGDTPPPVTPGFATIGDDFHDGV